VPVGALTTSLRDLPQGSMRHKSLP
jgi:hypothetical protein